MWPRDAEEHAIRNSQNPEETKELIRKNRKSFLDVLKGPAEPFPHDRKPNKDQTHD